MNRDPIIHNHVEADDSEDDFDVKPTRRSGRRKIKIEYIEDKNRRHITFSKRKAGIMKKAYELSTLTGTQVLLLVVSETGLVYTFTTVKLQPIVTKPEGKNLIQACLNATEPESNDDDNENPPPPPPEPKAKVEKTPVYEDQQQYQPSYPPQNNMYGGNNYMYQQQSPQSTSSQSYGTPLPNSYYGMQPNYYSNNNDSKK